MGGCGITDLTIIAKDAYEASYETAMGISAVRQEDRVEARNEALIAQLTERDSGLTTHLAAAKEAPYAAFSKAAIQQQQHFAPEAVKAAVRHRLRAPHKCLPSSLRCPGCQVLITAAEFSSHVSGCARIHGFNSSSRHALVKNVMNDLFASAGVPHDSSEPREFGEIHCPGCSEKFEEEAACCAHIERCPRVQCLSKVVQRPRRSGPDGRVHLAEGTVVFDLTIVSPTAPSFVGKGLAAALKARVADKTRKYAEAVAAAGEEFVVAGATSFGALSKDTKEFLKRVAKHSEGRVTTRELEVQLGCSVFLMTGHVIFAAERRAGVIHSKSVRTASSSSLTQIPQEQSGRVSVSEAVSERRE
jgi:hypothetical protein